MISADKILTQQQLAKLLKTLRQSNERALSHAQNKNRISTNDRRVIIDYYLYSLISNTGLRISEAIKLAWNDIHEDFLIIQSENSKNRKKGTVYYGPKTQKLLSEFKFIKQEKLNSTQTNLVFSVNGKTPSRSYAHMRFKFWLGLCGLPLSFSIHSLRHTYGTNCLDNGLSLTFVRDQLRHSNISITSQYLHLTKENRDRVKDLF